MDKHIHKKEIIQYTMCRLTERMILPSRFDSFRDNAELSRVEADTNSHFITIVEIIVYNSVLIILIKKKRHNEITAPPASTIFKPTSRSVCLMCPARIYFYMYLRCLHKQAYFNSSTTYFCYTVP